MTSEVVSRLIGHRVTVFSGDQAGSRDDGVVQAADTVAIALVNDKGETMVFPLTGIRLIKIVAARN